MEAKLRLGIQVLAACVGIAVFAILALRDSRIDPTTGAVITAFVLYGAFGITFRLLRNGNGNGKP